MIFLYGLQQFAIGNGKQPKGIKGAFFVYFNWDTPPSYTAHVFYHCLCTLNHFQHCTISAWLSLYAPKKTVKCLSAFIQIEVNLTLIHHVSGALRRGTVMVGRGGSRTGNGRRGASDSECTGERNICFKFLCASEIGAWVRSNLFFKSRLAELFLTHDTDV